MGEFDFRSSKTADFTLRREERETQLSQPSGRTAELNTGNKHALSHVGRKQTRTRIRF